MLRTITTRATGMIAAAAIVLVSLLSLTASARAQDRAQDDARPYPKMLPLEQVSNGPQCRPSRAARSAAPKNHFKGRVCFGAHGQRLGNSGQGYERFCVHGGAVMDGQHRLYDVLESQAERGDLPQSSSCAIDPADL